MNPYPGFAEPERTLDGPPTIPRHKPESSMCEELKRFLVKNFLPLGFLLVLIVALIWPLPGKKSKAVKVFCELPFKTECHNLASG